MGRQVFTAGEILTAANMNDLSDQTVMVFDDSAARGSAIPTPSEGMVTYLKDTDAIEKYTTDWVPAAPGKILQVVSTTKTDTFTTSSTDFADVTGLTVSITPLFSSSKVLLLADVQAGMNSDGNGIFFRLMRGATPVAIATDTGALIPATFGIRFDSASTNQFESLSGNFLDSPASTSAITYAVQSRVTGATGFVNRTSGDANARVVSTITAIEVAG
jgi:hypothetical protein